MSNDPAAPDESEGQLPTPADANKDAPDQSDAVPPRASVDPTPEAGAPIAPSNGDAPLAAPDEPLAAAQAPRLVPFDAFNSPIPEPASAETIAAGTSVDLPEPAAQAYELSVPDIALAGTVAAAEASVEAPEPAVQPYEPDAVGPPGITVWPPPEPVDPYVDVPASLELAYTSADVGLSDRAYDRAYPYEVIEKKRRRTAGSRARKVGRELAETVILALLIFFAVKAVVQNFRVEGASMEPSMHNNEYLLVNKALYFRTDLGRLHDFLPFIPGGDDSEHHLFRAPRRGDVIVFKFPLDPSRDFIKRVIGVPGDTVEVRDETVFINGNPLSENYIKDKPNYTYAPKTVPPGMYYVLGDNRRNSFDSHAWGNSCSPQQLCDFVPEENIIGQAWVSYWPFDQLGFINNKIIKPQAP